MATITIVDDSPVNALPLARLLQYNGHKVETILRARTAFDVLHRNQPDLVLLDVSMPDIDGIELLQMMREDPATRPLHVIMYSALFDQRLMDQASRLGALDYLVKGSDWEMMLHRIEDHLPAEKRGKAGSA